MAVAESLTIRLARPDDARQVLEIYGPYCDTPISFEAFAPSEETIRQRIVKVLETLPWLICEAGGQVAGYVYATPFRERAGFAWSVETAVYVRPQFARRGIGRGLYTSLFEILCRQGYYNAYAGITTPNPGSVGLHEAMGFKSVGVYSEVGFKCGAWHDVFWLHLALQAKPVEPTPTRPLAEIQAIREWPALLASGLPLMRSALGR